ncbi:hypothetical protein [Egbenema bharatensis]|uniref:hypothetical protein n=1 Tax=Egbenema bharatensis TaxID=3463334 RepID=UPI003A844A04
MSQMNQMNQNSTIEPTSLQPPEDYPVTLWETIGIIMGAIVLVVIGVAGLGVKAVQNAYEPERAEAIAHSLITYDLRDGRGQFGTNVGGARIAVISSNEPPAEISPSLRNQAESLPHSIELLVARIPVSQESESLELEADISHGFFSGFSFLHQVDGVFEVTTQRTEYREFCGGLSPVILQRGVLTLPDQSTLPAVRYGVEAKRETDHYIAIITAVGQNASSNAIELFRSIRCTTVPPSSPLTQQSFTINP